MKKIIAFILIVFLSIYNYSSAKKYKFKFYEKSIINLKSISIDASYKHYQKMEEET